MSWKFAQDMCRQMGGVLPIFQSKQEMDEFVAMLKLLPYGDRGRYEDAGMCSHTH